MQEDIETNICEFFESMPKGFYSNEINKLVNRGKEVVDNEIRYNDD